MNSAEIAAQKASSTQRREVNQAHRAHSAQMSANKFRYSAAGHEAARQAASQAARKRANRQRYNHLTEEFQRVKGEIGFLITPHGRVPQAPGPTPADAAKLEFFQAFNTFRNQRGRRQDEEAQYELFSILARFRGGGPYEDVEDGFTETRANFDPSTVTLQGLAEYVKTISRDLQRAGLL